MSTNFNASSPRAGFPPATVGGLVWAPVIFCPHDAVGCADAMRAEGAAFRAQIRPIQAMVAQGRCDEARRAASQLGQPLFEAHIASWCATGRRS